MKLEISLIAPTSVISYVNLHLPLGLIVFTSIVFMGLILFMMKN